MPMLSEQKFIWDLVKKNIFHTKPSMYYNKKQGRVKPTTQLAGGAQIYDNGSI